ncbi:MAG: holo-ACP synthase [Candidatus Omnitrophica bacterium]|nr:holo-ACP synthase [Candidatus Omnitrophota bacterium]
MIIGTGIDIIEVERIEKAIERGGDNFLKRIFTVREIGYAKSKKLSSMHLAGRFAAKEAVLKGFSRGQFNFKDIEILNDDVGRPFCRLSRDGFNIAISISHTENYAVASAVIEKKAQFT